MPQTKYTNADLKRFARTPGNYTEYGPVINREQDTPEPEARVNIDQLLADAKGTLARAQNFHNYYQGDQALAPGAPDEATAALSAENPSALDTPIERLKKLVVHYVKTRPQAAEKAAYAGIFANPAVAIPSEAILAATSGARLLGGEDTSTAGKIFDLAQLAGGGTAALRGLREVAGLTPAALRTARDFAARTGEAATRAGEAAKMRYAARQFEAAGGTPERFYIKTGMNPNVQTGVSPFEEGYAAGGFHPNAPRSISTAKNINYTQDPISELMAGDQRAFQSPEFVGRDMAKQFPWEGGRTTEDAIEGVRDRAANRRLMEFSKRTRAGSLSGLYRLMGGE